VIRSPLRVEVLESREVPSATAEEVFSLPRLDGMSAKYPIDPAPAVWEQRFTLTHEPGWYSSEEGIVGRPLRAEQRGRFAVASGGGTSTVNVYDSATNALLGTVSPFDRSYRGAVFVATADLTGDRVDDIVAAAGTGSTPRVLIYDGATLTEVRRFLAYAETFRGGVFVAAGDVTGDGRADLVTGAGGGGGPHVKLFDGARLFPEGDVQAAVEPVESHGFFAYDATFHGGVSVAVGDVNGDGVGDVVTGAGPGGGPHVRAISGVDYRELASFFAYDPAMTRGVMVAAGDVLGANRAQIVTAPMHGGSPHLRAFDNGAVVRDYRPFDSNLRTGASVAMRDLDDNGIAEVIAASGGGVRPQVRVLESVSGDVGRVVPALPPNYTEGLYVG
jgi:hypothetical protein